MKEIMGRRIKGLRELFGLTQEDLAEALGVSKPFVSMIESGARLPSLETISKLSRIFHKDADYFMKEEEEPFAALFRVESLGIAEKMELNKATKFASDYAFLEKESGQEFTLPPDYSRSYAIREKGFDALYNAAERMANEEARRLGVDNAPIKDIFSLMESQGVHVIRQAMGNIELDGVFLFSQESGAFVMVNSSKTFGRQVFTAAHEYCHFLKDRDAGIQVDRNIFSSYDSRSASVLEKFANMFASAFLMPRGAIDKAINNMPHLGPEEVIQLKRTFGVSYEAMVWRLFNLGHINQKRKDEFRGIKPTPLEVAIFGSTGEEAKPPKVPDRYFRLAMDAYSEDKITMSRLSELLDVDVFTLRAALSESGIKEGRRSGEKRPS